MDRDTMISKEYIEGNRGPIYQPVNDDGLFLVLDLKRMLKCWEKDLNDGNVKQENL